MMSRTLHARRELAALVALSLSGAGLMGLAGCGDASGAASTPSATASASVGLPAPIIAGPGSTWVSAKVGDTIVFNQPDPANSTITSSDPEVVEVTPQGDVDPGSLTTIGGTGVFVAAVREAVAAGQADLAVHSLKDLPTAPDPRLRLAAIPVREDPSDALVARGVGTLAGLPTGARVGTGSPRRRAQLAAARPDLQVVDLRGNVDTRIAHVDGDPSRGIPYTKDTGSICRVP